MKDSGLKINILTPSGQIYSEGINSCMIPGIEGQFQILENHASLLSIVDVGLIKIIDSNKFILNRIKKSCYGCFFIFKILRILQKKRRYQQS